MTKPSDVSMLRNRTWPFYVNFAPSWRKNIHVKHIKIVIFEIMERNLTWSSRLVSQSYLQLSWPGFVRWQLLLLMPPFTEIKAWWTVSELSLKSLKYRIANQLSGYEWYCVMLRQARVLTTNEQRTGEPNSTTTVYLQRLNPWAKSDQIKKFKQEKIIVDVYANKQLHFKFLTLVWKLANQLYTSVSLKMAERSFSSKIEIFWREALFALLASLRSAIFNETEMDI